MRLFVSIFVGVVLCGCSLLPSAPKKAESAPVASAETNSPSAVSILSSSGKIAMVNANLHFVVMTFPPGEVPAIGRNLNVYRNGEKVGEVKVTGPQRDFNTVADVVSGEPQANDEVRPN